MPSPRWSAGRDAPIAAAIAAAAHEAWAAGPEDRVSRFSEALRKMVGAEAFSDIETTALRVFLLQADPPDGYEVAPSWAWFRICPGCQRLRRTPHTAPQNGRLKLQVLRDPEWLSRAFERGESLLGIAQRLGCAPGTVRHFAEKHGLRSPQQRRSEEIEDGVRRMYAAGEGPGKTARELNTSVRTVRDALKRLGLANNKSGQVYHDRAWWTERLERRAYTKAACAREAGIRPHNANYYLDKFSLQHLVDQKRRRPPKYPELHDRDRLRELLDRHGTYAAASAAVGCSPTLVSKQARDLLGYGRRWKPVPHGRRRWWRQRLDRGATTWEMATEAAVSEKAAREKLRLLGLLPEAYANNARHERARRRAS